MQVQQLQATGALITLFDTRNWLFKSPKRGKSGLAFPGGIREFVLRGKACKGNPGTRQDVCSLGEQVAHQTSYVQGWFYQIAVSETTPSQKLKYAAAAAP